MTALALSSADIHALGAGEAIIRDGWLPPDLVGAARAEADALPFRPAQIAGGLRPDIRGDALCWLDAHPPTPGLAALVAGFDALAPVLNEAAYLGLRRVEVQVARYAAGAAYARHRDARAGVARSRVVTAICYLNAGWAPDHGGILRLYPASGGQVDVAPLGGRLVVFLSDRLDHEVLPARAPRLAATGWYYAHDELRITPAT